MGTLTDQQAHAPSDPAALLRRVGEALYGDRWQSALAHELQINERTMRRWLSGAQPVPADRWAELRQSVLLRRDRLAQLLQEFEAP
jgi:hypothetical protein